MMAFASLIGRGQKTWIFLAAVVFVVIVAAGVVLGPIRGRFRALDEAIVGQEKKAAGNWRVLSADTKGAAVSNYQQFGNTIPRRGSTSEETASMLAEIERQATELGIVLAGTKQLPTDSEKGKSDYEEYRFDVGIECDMKQLVSFLYGVESSAQLLRVERVSLESKGGGVFRGSLVLSKLVTL